MIQFILEKLILYYPPIGLYFLLIFSIVYITYKVTIFYLKTKNVNDEFPDMKTNLQEMKTEVAKIPRMEKILERIDRNLSALSDALFEKGIITRSYHTKYTDQ